MQLLCSERILQLPRSGIRRMFDLAAKHPDAIHLCMGEPDFTTPSFIIEAAFQAAKEGGDGSLYLSSSSVQGNHSNNN